MDSEGEGVRTPKMEAERALNSKMKGAGNMSRKDMIFRADKIDLNSFDAQLEKHLSRVWSRSIETKCPKEEWEVDLAKLDLRYVVAHGAYGTIYRGTYDTQDVAEEIIKGLLAKLVENEEEEKHEDKRRNMGSNGQEKYWF